MPRSTPAHRSPLLSTTTVPALNIAASMEPANPCVTSPGQKPLKAMMGNSRNDGSGGQKNPMAARCGSLVKSTLNALSIRAYASSIMKWRWNTR